MATRNPNTGKIVLEKGDGPGVSAAVRYLEHTDTIVRRPFPIEVDEFGLDPNRYLNWHYPADPDKEPNLDPSVEPEARFELGANMPNQMRLRFF